MAEHPKPRLLIEEWLPAAAVGVECMRERGSASALAPHTYLHVWWARRPLCASRAAVLASLLPADFPHDVFERCLGMVGKTGDERVALRALMDEGARIDGGFSCERAFKAPIPKEDLESALSSMHTLWRTADISVIDPMAGGGSIPLEAARLGLNTFANEYNPVACSVLEATVDYPFKFGPKLAERTRFWAKEIEKRIERRLSTFYPKLGHGSVHAYIYARTVPCPDTGFHTPLVSDWHLMKPKSGTRIVANPVADKLAGTWSIQVRTIGKSAGELRETPNQTYKGGSGISLFSGRPIPSDWVKQKAQAGEMKSCLYAVAFKTASGLQFRPPTTDELKALEDAEVELNRLRPDWEKQNVIPTELYPAITTDERPRTYGMPRWADLFTPRQLLSLGTIVDELKGAQSEIRAAEGDELGEAIIHMLAFAFDKFMNHNGILTRFEVTRAVVKGKMDRHDFAFKTTFAELAPCTSGAGFAWSVDNVCEAASEIAKLAAANRRSVTIERGSSTSLPWISDGSMTAVVVDPPYDDNVQYSELADFFYVWLKRTQGHRKQDWFSSYLCENDQEAVVNHMRHGEPQGKAKEAKDRARTYYRKLMMETFAESRRILRDDGALTVMFTHKKQEAWEALFGSLVEAGFVITATWPVKTESEHSLHQAKKNAAQSTVILVARKRPPGAGKGYFTGQMQDEIRDVARTSAIRLQGQGLNAVDQLVGSFGPAMEVYSRFDQVVTDTGIPVAIGEALDIASDAVSSWRVEQLAARGLDGVEAEGRFALLCWDVLGAEEFRFNEAKLLGHAVGMDVESLVVAGLVTKSGDKIKMVPARDRKREDPLKPEEIQTLFGTVVLAKKGKKKDVLKVHPGDAGFRTALDACHAMAIEYIEGRDPQRGIALVKALSRRHGWTKDSDAVRLMEALVVAAPDGVRFDRGKTSAGAQFPEFRAWHHILGEVFGLEQPEWKMKVAAKTLFDVEDDIDEEEEEGDEE